MVAEAVRIGTRGSPLALWQAEWARRRLSERLPDLVPEVVVIRTTGDKILDSPLSKIGDKGLFTREIEAALLRGEIDLAVHSLKDLPTELPGGLSLGAVSEREDVRDVFVPHPQRPAQTLDDVPLGAAIATGSLRRASQLRSFRPDLNVVDIRGNLQTRYRKLEDSDWAGMLLARAGVVRLGWEDRIGEVIDVAVMLPAVGQGALGIEVRSGDRRVSEIVSHLHDEQTFMAVSAERALLRRLEGGCQIPVGGYGRVETRGGRTGVLVLDAMVGSLDGTTVFRGRLDGPLAEAERVGVELAERLLDEGAGKILREIRSGGGHALKSRR